MREALINFSKVYYPQTYKDFNETSPGMMFIEMGAYVGDVLSYYIDKQFKESLFVYATERETVMDFSYVLGYKPKPIVPVKCNRRCISIDSFQCSCRSRKCTRLVVCSKCQGWNGYHIQHQFQCVL